MNRRFLPFLLLACTLNAQPPARSMAQEHWTGTWAASPCAPPAVGDKSPLVYQDETLRLVVHTSIGGDAVRIRLSNTFSTEPMTVGAAHLALHDQQSGIRSGTDHALTFSGRSSVMIPGGASVLSDPLPMALPALADVAVSLYLPGQTAPGAVHYSALQTSYSAAGDQTGAATLQDGRTLERWPVLTALEVSSSTQQGAIVALGSSTTDGAHSTKDANHRWTDYLAVRLQTDRALKNLAVLNEGIGGNRVLHDGGGPNGLAFGVSASARFDRDVLAQAGVRYVVLFEGGNDINHPGNVVPLSEAVTAEDLIAGYRQLIARAHEHGLRVIVGTITQFVGNVQPETEPAREAKRIALNHWILSQKDADGTVDFARALADPARPERFAPQFDSGDHLHPNDAGYKAMSDMMDLNLFRH
ncbi:MAG: SGNH/GDSL hydrolase family protein [Janthinobacterium lividum]